MNSVNRPNRILTLTALGTALFAFALRLVCVLFFYDTESGYYSSGAVLPIISDITLALSAAALLVLSILKAPCGRTVDAPSGISRWLALLPALAMAVCAVQLIGGGMGSASLIHVLSLLGAVAGAGFFCCLAFIDRPSPVTVICGTGFVIFLATAWISSYTDFTVTMNSPDKLLFNLACAGAALFTVGELRAVYDTARARSYYCYASLALLTLSAGPVVATLGNILGKYSGNAVRGEDLPLMAVAVYVAVRLATLRHSAIPDEYEFEEDLDSCDEYCECYEPAEPTEQLDTADENSGSKEN